MLECVISGQRPTERCLGRSEGGESCCNGAITLNEPLIDICEPQESLQLLPGGDCRNLGGINLQSFLSNDVTQEAD